MQVDGSGFPLLNPFYQNWFARAPMRPRNASDQVRAALRQIGRTREAVWAKTSAFRSDRPIERIANGRLSIINTDPVRLGGKHDYTREDAWARYQSGHIRFDETLSDVAFVPPPEGGMDVARDFSWARIDFNAVCAETGDLRRSVDYLASRYVTLRQRVEREVPAEQRDARIAELDALLRDAGERLARSFAGGLAEAYDAHGERERFEQSVLDGLAERVGQYAGFARTHEDYAAVGPEEAWLSKDSAYLAAALRAGMTAQDAAAAEGRYTLDELGKLSAFAQELDGATRYVPGSSRELRTGEESEESLGMKLAELKLKATVLAGQPGVSDPARRLLTGRADRFIADTIAREQAHWNETMRVQIEAVNDLCARGGISPGRRDADVAAIRRGCTGLNTSAVHAVIAQVERAYARTGDAGSAILEGALFAIGAYTDKLQSGEAEGIRRYEQGTLYWNNFFVNRDVFHDRLGGYRFAQSGLESIAQSWGRFTARV